MTMRHFTGGIALFLLAILVLPLCAQDKNANKKDLDKDKDKELTTNKDMVKAGQVVGKILAVAESKRTLRLQVTLVIQEINQGEVNGLLQAKQNYVKAQLNRDLNGMVNAQRDIAQHQLNLYKYRQETKDIDVSTTEDVKVRRANPPEQFDDKGQLKKYTAKELKDLRGKDKLPGYSAEFSDLGQDQYVTITLVRKKDMPKPGTPKPKNKDAEFDLSGESAIQASMIMIVRDPK
jgi:hypothetical protein